MYINKEQTKSLNIIDIVNRIDNGTLTLPSFQRGYVWNGSQVKNFVQSIYLGYPVGTLLLWETKKIAANQKDTSNIAEGDIVTLILDGQQRITTLYGILRQLPPPFFEGKSIPFTNLRFNAETEVFEFYQKQKMETSETKWIDISSLMRIDDMHSFFKQKSYLSDTEKDNVNRLYLQLRNCAFQAFVLSRDIPQDIVIEIFKRVNTGNTKLSETDIELAKLCGLWSNVRQELNNVRKYGFHQYQFSMEWMLRCLTIYITEQPKLKELELVDISDFKAAIPICKHLVTTILDKIRTVLYLDNDKVLVSKSAIMIMMYYLKHVGTAEISKQETNLLLYWYIHTILWGRYSSSVITNLAQDINTIKDGKGINGLIETIENSRGGNLLITAKDFADKWSSSSTFYPLLYMLTRHNKAKDFETGVAVDVDLIAQNTSLEVHHIFPSNRLYYPKPEKGDKHKAFKKDIVNSIANYAIITKQTNDRISDKDPQEYLPYYMQKQPGAIESHWIPTDPTLWEYENYVKFLEARRELLAKAANDLLQSLNPNHPTK